MYSGIKVYGTAVLLLIVVTTQHVQGARRNAALEGISEENNDNFDTSRYKFAYGVEDHKTGDFKMHQEERDGDVVKGEYTVADADGTLRTVRYTADSQNGFQAVITKAGDPHQQVIPAPAHATTYQRSVKDSSTVSSNHYYNQNSNDEGAPRYTNTHNSHIPVKKYIQDLPQFAKLYAVKHNKIVENFDSENAAHYQTVNIDNNKDRTHYSYKLMQGEQEKEANANAKDLSKQFEVYGQKPMVFQMQKPQGFRKVEDVPLALPLQLTNSQSNINNGNVQVNHAPYPINHASRGNSGNHLSQMHHASGDSNSDDDNNYENEEDTTETKNSREIPVQEPQWKQIDHQGRNNRQIDNYKQRFVSQFGKFRRPAGNDQGAYSYMNFEGETNNGYELQHTFHGKKPIPRAS